MRKHDLLDATVTAPAYERQSKPICPTETQLTKNEDNVALASSNT